MLPSQFCFWSSQVGNMANKEEHDQVKWVFLCKTSVKKKKKMFCCVYRLSTLMQKRKMTLRGLREYGQWAGRCVCVQKRDIIPAFHHFFNQVLA